MSNRSVVRFSIFVSLLLAATFAFAASPVGDMHGGGPAVSWTLKVSGHEKVVLTLSTPDGDSFSREYAGGSVVSFNLKDLPTVVDGAYNYQLTVIPRVSAGVKKQLENARKVGDEIAIRGIMKANGLGSPTVQSGTFTVANGLIVSPDLSEPTSHDSARVGGMTTDGIASGTGPVSPGGTRRPGAPAVNDQVIPDDLIVQGSACVGLDCVDGENFGFDTIRMKENNLRVHFEDTSTSAGFPANDWRIIANDSASGGANKLSIEDSTAARDLLVVTAGAPANSVFLANTGKVGFRNAAPVLDLHMTTTDTPAVRFEQTNAGGFTAQTWDIGANEANFFVRDVTGGSRLPFRVRPGATTSSVDISGDGDVGINTASPNANAKLDIFDSTQAKARLVLSGQEFSAAATTSNDGIGFVLGVNRTGNRQLWITDSANLAVNNSNKLIRIQPNGADVSALTTDGSSTSLTLQRSAGDVGIGTLPSSKLHVAGDIRITGGSFIDDGVTLTAPDYVFEAGYNLMPLDKVADFIRAEKHLPNIPSAKEIKANGLNVSKMQMNLLEKVEELTLHTIAQHEQIGSLKAENQKLQERLAAIEAAIAKKQ